MPRRLRADAAPSLVGASKAPCMPSPHAARRSISVTHRLLDRELDATMQQAFVRRSTRQRFAHLSLRKQMDLYGSSSGFEFAVAERCRITELCTAGGLVYGLSESGLCVAFSLATGQRVCTLNLNHTEVVRSLFHNKANGTLITVSVFASDLYACLRCRASTLANLRAGVTDQSVALFESESLRYPGFVEFDDVNGKVLTLSAEAREYKVWSMAEPNTMLYRFSGEATPGDGGGGGCDGVSEIKVSPGIMLLVGQSPAEEDTALTLRIVSMESGETLRRVRQPIRRGKAIEVIEQFGSRLLLKQHGGPLLIIDMLTSSVTKMRQEYFRRPCSLIYLYEHDAFLAFRENSASVWSFKGELLREFDDHTLCIPHPDIDHASVMYITPAQDVLISLCEDSATDGTEARAAKHPRRTTELSRAAADDKPAVSIHVSSLFDGRCIARLDAKRVGEQPDTTSICYAEEVGAIITGNEHGRIEIWDA